MIQRVIATIALFAAPVTALSGCSNQAADNSSTSTTSGSSGAQTLTTQLKTTDGEPVADASIDFTSGYATVTVETVGTGILSPGLHALHIHAVGTCEGDFTSAGDHFQAPGHTGQPASGDLPSLLVRSDGAGKLVATSDSFTEDQLKGPDGSAIMLHQSTGTGPGDAADQRFACGVLSPASTTGTSVSTSTSTVTTTAATAVPPATETATATVTETTSTPPASSSSVAPSTSTSTVTVIEPPSIPAITVPPLPGPDGG
jgi:Cu-Zn family superoxide dismutase